MDELAAAAGADPLDFRLAHLDNPRIRAVLETAAKHFDWADAQEEGHAGTGRGPGLRNGEELRRRGVRRGRASIARRGQITVREICEAFECGPIMNPANLLSQVQGCIIMGLGGALTEEMQFEDGKILNASFCDTRCRVSRMSRGSTSTCSNKTGHPLGRRRRNPDHRGGPGHRQRRLRRLQESVSAPCRSTAVNFMGIEIGVGCKYYLFVSECAYWPCAVIQRKRLPPSDQVAANPGLHRASRIQDRRNHCQEHPPGERL